MTPRIALAALALALVLAVTGLTAGCAEQERRPRSTLVVERGVSVALPPGWQAADERLTPKLADPQEVVAVGTFPLRHRDTRCAHLPGSALEDLGPRDALITLQERGTGGSEFQERPARFGPELGGPSEASECVPRGRFRDHWFEFADAGRSFHVLVAFGPQAPAVVQEEAWGVLDGLRVARQPQPGWESAG